MVHRERERETWKTISSAAQIIICTASALDGALRTKLMLPHRTDLSIMFGKAWAGSSSSRDTTETSDRVTLSPASTSLGVRESLFLCTTCTDET